MKTNGSSLAAGGTTSENALEVFSTCPQSIDVAKEHYLKRVAEIARWSEEAGCKGILVYTDNSLVDAWMVSQIIVEHTRALCPLVAVQPAYMHPYTVAKMVTSFAHLYDRRLYLNMVAGGFKNDLEALNDQTPHDQRYERMIEYVTIIKQLLVGEAPVTFHGQYYSVDKLKLTPALPVELFPGMFVSGSSEAGLAAAQAIGATAVKYPKPVDEYQTLPENMVNSGVRVGIVTRATEDEAWTVAHARFPADRKGQLTHQLAMKVSDSLWHKQLSEMGNDQVSETNPYWLVPFQNYKTFCPYLVGSYQRVAEELARYVGVGYNTFILDIPPNQEELHHIKMVFEKALRGVAACA
jgi:alkanesulfonate monooxygenase